MCSLEKRNSEQHVVNHNREFVIRHSEYSHVFRRHHHSIAGIIFSQVLNVDWETFIELSALWNPYPSLTGSLWNQRSNTEACLQRETEQKGRRGEDGVKRKEQDTMMERAESKRIPAIDRDKYPYV